MQIWSQKEQQTNNSLRESQNAAYAIQTIIIWESVHLEMESKQFITLQFHFS